MAIPRHVHLGSCVTSSGCSADPGRKSSAVRAGSAQRRLLTELLVLVFQGDPGPQGFPGTPGDVGPKGEKVRGRAGRAAGRARYVLKP